MDPLDEAMTAQEILPDLFLGSLVPAGNEAYLSEIGVSHILVVAEELAPVFPERFAYKHVPLFDNNDPRMLDNLAECHTFIDDALAGGGKVLVHCAAGASRSASVVCAYVMRRTNVPMDRALDHCRERRGCVNPNHGFRQQLRLFQMMGNKVDPAHEHYIAWKAELALDTEAKLTRAMLELATADDETPVEDVMAIVSEAFKPDVTWGPIEVAHGPYGVRLLRVSCSLPRQLGVDDLVEVISQYDNVIQSARVISENGTPRE